MGAANFFRNLRPLSQYQSPKSIHDRLDDHDPREGWMLPQNTVGHHKANGTQMEPKQANSQKKTALPLQISDTSGIISDTSGIFGHVRYFQQQADQGRKIQNPVKRCPKNMKFLTIALRHQGKVSTKFQLKTPKLEISDTS